MQGRGRKTPRATAKYYINGTIVLSDDNHCHGKRKEQPVSTIYYGEHSYSLIDIGQSLGYAGGILILNFEPRE